MIAIIHLITFLEIPLSLSLDFLSRFPKRCFLGWVVHRCHKTTGLVSSDYSIMDGSRIEEISIQKNLKKIGLRSNWRTTRTTAGELVFVI